MTRIGLARLIKEAMDHIALDRGLTIIHASGTNVLIVTAHPDGDHSEAFTVVVNSTDS